MDIASKSTESGNTSSPMVRLVVKEKQQLNQSHYSEVNLKVSTHNYSYHSNNVS